MDLVLSAHHLASIGGAETYLLTVAEQLERLGHEVLIHCEELGEMAEEARSRGLRVTDRPGDLPERCDAVLVQDSVTSPLLAERFPEAPQVFVSHGIAYDWMLPPQLPGLVSTVVAMNERVAKRVRASAIAPEVARLHQPIDLERFAPRGAPRARPRRLVAIGNYLRGPRRALLVDVCDDLGIEFRQIGAHGDSAHARPELEIADADIVVGYGRSALEGMASGKAVYVFDHTGGDGWVTAESYETLEANGFAGTGTVDVVDAARLRNDLRAYHPELGLVARELARTHHDAIRHTAELAGILADGRAPRPAPDAPLRELARLARVQWQIDGRAALLRIENDDLRTRLEDREAWVERAHGAERRLADLKATRRWRAGAAIATPLDRARQLALRAPRPRLRQLARRQSPRIIALVAFRDERRYLPGLLENLEPLVDGLVALDDGSNDDSAEIVSAHPLTLELLRLPEGAQDELMDGQNHRRLTEAAWRFGADWLYGIDADERLERGFRERATAEIRRADWNGDDGVWVHVRELWGAPDRWRADGIWGRKRKPTLFRSDPGHRFDGRRVHAMWPSCPPRRGDWPQGDLILYHLRMIDPEDRERRVEKFKRIDPHHEWQAIGYDYMLDEDELELRALEPGRDYVPLAT